MPAACPHCRAANEHAGAFCTVCGKAMPSAEPGGPRVLGTHDLASSNAGRSLQMDHLARHIRTGYRTLLFVGILQIVLGAVVAVLAMIAPPEVQGLGLIATFVAGIGAVFLALSFWARHDPLPATVTGLTLFLSSWLLDIIGDPSMALRGAIIKLAIALFLGRAVAAAVKHRALKRQIEQEETGSGQTRTTAIRSSPSGTGGTTFHAADANERMAA